MTERRRTEVTRRIQALPEAVYRALVDPDLIIQWLPPEGMTGTIHAFEPEADGRFSMSLMYGDPSAGPGGKTTEDTDTFEGRFIDLVPNQRVIQAVVFESEKPSMAGEMRITWELADADGATNVTNLCEDIPPGIRLEDNEAGCRSSLENLARLVEPAG